MQILDVYTKKDYQCPICKQGIYYAKIANDKGELVTKDRQPPNGKFGKENNVLSGAVDMHVKDRLHSCTEGKLQQTYNELTQAGLAEQAINAKGDWSKAARIKWPDKKDFIAFGNKEQDLIHGFNSVEEVAYFLTKEQHPELSDQDNVFGQIVHAKSLVLTNLLIAENLKLLRESKTN